jgi:serine/threonine protein phosphatase PrpC
VIASERAHLHVAAKSHPGISGKNNEDRYAVSAFRTNTGNPVPSVLAIVADGIGGHRAGEIAAEIAVETISAFIASSDIQHPTKTLEEAVILASQAIYNQSEANVNQKGMGATCACGWIIGDRLYTVSVGDSRIYLIRDQMINQLTTDHTWIQEAIERGALTQEEAQGHPNAHVIRRYLGSRQTVIPDFRLRLTINDDDTQAEANQGVRLNPNDQLILCSDGLTDLVSDGEILAVLNDFEQEPAIDQLIGLANQRGGHDNITIVSLKMPATAVPEPAASPAPPAQRHWLGIACLGLGILTIIGVLLVGAGYWYFTRPSPQPPAGLVTGVATTSPAILIPDTPFPTRTPFAIRTATLPADFVPLESPTPSQVLFTLTPWPAKTIAP